ncbi:protein FAR1-RELATED SEQUENCE 2-like [Chenopodium quinoa]|uniref:protein FAR1-RELATED SEQUENCE 2-like n=1 Tax=Chenopodium quinoa TaxID=63459 RepID=UPI000B78BE1D|nr:protein FAR1-RELATED SEQUENCE 2-like [Chenopodium quinoa]
MSGDNQNFFHLCRFGKDDALQDIVWVDARSRAAYEEFGDVVCFDNTYLINKFHLPFAVFIGVNHHGQSIFFGCALISWEMPETYEWVLRTWLHCMGGKAPISILTDQDPAIRKVVNLIMPEICHRWCIWHILQKFSRYVGKHEDYEAVKDEFENIIYGSLDAVEFVDRWAGATDYYKLGDNSWLEVIFVRVCRGGVAGYVQGIGSCFSSDLEYEQIRSESERIEDSNTIRYVRHLATDFPAEEVFRKCYTDAKFKEVQRECKRMLYVRRLDDYEVDENQVEFVIEDRVWIKPKYANKESVTKVRRCYRVCYDSNTYEASCDCKHFECHGIICRHMIFVYDHCGVSIVPEKYILRRWRKDIQRKHTRVKVAYHDPLKTDEARQYHKLMRMYEPIRSKASACKEGVEAVAELLQLMDLRVDEMLAMVAKKQEESAKDNENEGEDDGVHYVVRTPSSVALNKGPGCTNTPATHASGLPNTIPTPISAFVGSCDGSIPAVIKDPPLPKKKAHRTTNVRYPSCTEKKGKEKTARLKNAAKKQVAAAHNSMSFSTNDYVRSVGGIQMRDLDGSLGYFTSVRGTNSGGFFCKCTRYSWYIRF